MSKPRPVYPRIMLKLAENGRWYFFKLSKNGRKTEVSQTYSHKNTAVRAARRDIPGVPIHEAAE